MSRSPLAPLTVANNCTRTTSSKILSGVVRRELYIVPLQVSMGSCFRSLMYGLQHGPARATGQSSWTESVQTAELSRQPSKWWAFAPRLPRLADADVRYQASKETATLKPNLVHIHVHIEIWPPFCSSDADRSGPARGPVCHAAVDTTSPAFGTDQPFIPPRCASNVFFTGRA